MSAWGRASTQQKTVMVDLAIAGGQRSSQQIADAIGAPSRQAVIGHCSRNNITLPNARVVRSTGPKTKAKMQRAPKKPFLLPPPNPDQPLYRPHTTPAEFPKPGEGMPMDEAIEADGCRYIIGEWERCQEPEMCGKPLTPRDREKNFHLCASCQTHLINNSAHTRARQSP